MSKHDRLPRLSRHHIPALQGTLTDDDKTDSRLSFQIHSFLTNNSNAVYFLS